MHILIQPISCRVVFSRDRKLMFKVKPAHKCLQQLLLYLPPSCKKPSCPTSVETTNCATLMHQNK